MKTALALFSLLTVATFANDTPPSNDSTPRAGTTTQSASTPEPLRTAAGNTYDQRKIAGWNVYVNTKLIEEHPEYVEKALPLLQKMLEEIVRVVPAKAVAELQKIPFWMNPEYPKSAPKAAFHPGADWLRKNGRDPAMGKGIELTNARVFDQEARRMPNLALHELAHGYHLKVVGLDNKEIVEAYENAKASGKYAHARYQDAQGRIRTGGDAYAMTNYKEYFAETTEAHFSRNDVYPFNRAELKEADPGVCAVLEKLWGVEPAGESPASNSGDTGHAASAGKGTPP